jgi:rsbT co-antagonist protein RsbR
LLAAQAAIGIENARLYANIEASESRFRAIFEESKDVIFMLTRDGMFEAINVACEAVFGYTREEMEQMSFAQICAEQIDQDTWVSHLLEAEEVRDSEIRIRRQDGSLGEFLVTAAVRRDADGNVIGFQGIGRDITIQNQAREEAERAARQEQVIDAQRDVIRELSTPLLPLSDGVVMLPLVGTLDSVRSNLVMETLLQGIAEYRAEIALLDITGVPVMDTTVANVLVQTAQAARLLGATVILTGIGPTIAQTLVSLGVDLTGIITRSSLQDGIAYALRQRVKLR